jgi:hypothetical protein
MENIKIKMSKEQADLFENTGNIVIVSDKDVYINIPYWLKKTNEKYVFEYLTMDQLPVNIIKQQCYTEEDLEVAYFEGREGLYSFNDWLKQFKK